MLKGTDDAAFGTLMEDLCLAFNRPYSQELGRVFWEALKYAHIAEVKRKAQEWQRNGKKFPTPHDLLPEKRAAAAPPPVDDGPPMSPWAIAANKALMAVAYFDEKRGMKPMGDEKLKRALEIKRELVEMAENSEREGVPMDGMEYSDMLRSAFRGVLI